MAEAHPFPWVRWGAVLWLAVWVPAYAVTWGWPNFLLLCDMAVILTCIGLWTGNRLLLSTQAVTSMIPDSLWTLDVAWRLALGSHLIGGTEYMWDPQYPLWVRLLSCFHVFWPVLLVWALRRVGYDRRAFLWQSVLAVVLLILSRFFDPAKNMNFAFVDPIFKREWGSPPAHLTVILGVLILMLYWPTHRVLLKTLGVARESNAQQ